MAAWPPPGCSLHSSLVRGEDRWPLVERLHAFLDLRSSIPSWKESHWKGHIYTALAASIISLSLSRAKTPSTSSQESICKPPHHGSTWWETQRETSWLLASGHVCSRWSSEDDRCPGAIEVLVGLTRGLTWGRQCKPTCGALYSSRERSSL